MLCAPKSSRILEKNCTHHIYRVKIREETNYAPKLEGNSIKSSMSHRHKNELPYVPPTESELAYMNMQFYYGGVKKN